MTSTTPYLLNLINSVIGVSILSMPFCFYKCGVLLSIILLLVIGIFSHISSHFLVSTALITKKKSYESTVFYLFGSYGKVIVELSIIGMLMGSLIAFFVVFGELLPEIITFFSPMLTISQLRTLCLIVSAFCVILPLSLIKDVSYLSNLSGISIFLYTIFTFHIMFLSLESIQQYNTWSSIHWWRFNGIMECIPIFSLSFGCHTQLFVIFFSQTESVPNVDFIKSAVGRSIILSGVIYTLAGLFGYLAFASLGQLPGNIFSFYPMTLFSQTMKFIFLLSMVLSYPLVIFPCRSSVYSLLFIRKNSTEFNADVIPEKYFKSITFFIVFSTFLVSIFIPNVEVILSLNGAITGSLLCFIIPSILFLSSHVIPRFSIAHFICGLGFLMLIVSPYVTLTDTHLTQPELQAYMDSINPKVKLPAFSFETVKSSPNLSLRTTRKLSTLKLVSKGQSGSVPN